MGDKEKISIVKSVVHDATPSWNGFNYQGKVGLYVLLCFIDNLCQDSKLSADEIKKIAKEYTIEYEWVEDFSIKHNGNYKSIHQVKHYNSTAFSDYLDAIETAALRREGVVSSSDVIPYVKKEPNKKAVEVAAAFISYLISKKLLTEDQKISGEWRDFITDIDDDKKLSVENFLSSHEALQENAYLKSIPIFIHSNLPISKPVKPLSEYSWDKSVTSEIFKKKSLSDLNINVEKSSQYKFELSVGDDDLLDKLRQLACSLRIRVGAYDTEDEISESADCYVAALLMELDAHIADRHKNFGGNDFRTTKPRELYLSKIVEILSGRFVKQDRNYFALRTKLLFEIFMDEYLNQLDQNIIEAIKEGDDFVDFADRKNKVINFREHVTSKMSSIELLGHIEKCSPWLKVIPQSDLYYAQIITMPGMRDVFLKFIESLSSTPLGFHALCNEGFRYAPSFIDVSHDDGKPEVVLKRIAKKITEASNRDAYIGSLLYNFDFIAIKTKDDIDFPCSIMPPAVSDIPDGENYGLHPVFHEPKQTKLLNFKVAAKKANGND